MKKLLATILAMSVFLAACSADNSKTDEPTKDNEKVENESVEVDKGLLNVEITLPASFFEGEDIETVIAQAKEGGVKEVTKNDDGSLTYKMSKATHKEMMAEMEAGIIESVEGMTNGDFPSIKDVSYNKSFTEFTMIVDKEAYENSFDGFAVFGLGFSGMYYQYFNGVDVNKNKVTINVEDEATGELISSAVYPDALEELEDIEEQ